jgi:hypothetical protein
MKPPTSLRPQPLPRRLRPQGIWRFHSGLGNRPHSPPPHGYGSATTDVYCAWIPDPPGRRVQVGCGGLGPLPCAHRHAYRLARAGVAGCALGACATDRHPCKVDPSQACVCTRNAGSLQAQFDSRDSPRDLWRRLLGADEKLELVNAILDAEAGAGSPRRAFHRAVLPPEPHRSRRPPA